MMSNVISLSESLPWDMLCIVNTSCRNSIIWEEAPIVQKWTNDAFVSAGLLLKQRDIHCFHVRKIRQLRLSCLSEKSPYTDKVVGSRGCWYVLLVIVYLIILFGWFFLFSFNSGFLKLEPSRPASDFRPILQLSSAFFACNFLAHPHVVYNLYQRTLSWSQHACWAAYYTFSSMKAIDS